MVTLIIYSKQVVKNVVCQGIIKVAKNVLFWALQNNSPSVKPGINTWPEFSGDHVNFFFQSMPPLFHHNQTLWIFGMPATTLLEFCNNKLWHRQRMSLIWEQPMGKLTKILQTIASMPKAISSPCAHPSKQITSQYLFETSGQLYLRAGIVPKIL